MTKGKEFAVILFFLIFSIVIFRDYFIKGTLPVAVNLLGSFYEPWASYKWKDYPYGPPAKPNGFDSVQIYYPTRYLVLEQLKRLKFPLWNPYSFSGNVLHATYQASVFFPFSIFFFILPQIEAWSIIVMMQPFLAGISMYLFLQSLGLGKRACFFGALTFSSSGMLVVWWEEMFMAVYSFIPLPLVLFGIINTYKRVTALSLAVLIGSLSFSIFSGWFQATFYVFVFSFLYAFLFFIQKRSLRIKPFLYIIGCFLLTVLLCAVQLIPGFEAYWYSVRGLTDLKSVFSDHLVPWEQLLTFVAPDLFGSPAAHNYFGAGFYHERVIYIGIPPLLFAIYEFLHFKKNSFPQNFFKFSSIIILSLGFSIPTTWFFLYTLDLPFFSEMTPSRIFFLSAFTLSTVAACGLERYFSEKKGKKLFAVILILVILLLIGLYVGIFQAPKPYHIPVSLRNLILPSLLVIASSVIVICGYLKTTWTRFAYGSLIGITLFGILYFTHKYLYFSDRIFVFPNVPVLSQLQKISGIDRFWSVGEGYIPSNFSNYYHLYSPEGYDSFNVGRYNELLYSSHTQGKLSYQMPRANALLYKARTLDELENNPYRKKLLSLLGVKYLVSKHQETATPWLTRVWTDTVFDIYENKETLPRISLIGSYKVISKDKQTMLNTIYDSKTNLHSTVLLEEAPDEKVEPSREKGTVSSILYKPASVQFTTQASTSKLAFLSDNYFPGWRGYIDNVETKIYRANYTFRAVVVPKGTHEVKFVYRPRSFYIGAILSITGIVFSTLFFLFVLKKEKANRNSHEGYTL